MTVHGRAAGACAACRPAAGLTVGDWLAPCRNRRTRPGARTRRPSGRRCALIGDHVSSSVHAVRPPPAHRLSRFTEVSPAGRRPRHAAGMAACGSGPRNAQARGASSRPGERRAHHVQGFAAHLAGIGLALVNPLEERSVSPRFVVLGDRPRRATDRRALPSRAQRALALLRLADRFAAVDRDGEVDAPARVARVLSTTDLNTARWAG